MKKNIFPRLVTLILFLLVMVCFLYMRSVEGERSHQLFEKRTVQMANALNIHLQAYIEDMWVMGSLIYAGKDMNREGFHRFSQRLLKRSPGIQALEWIPRVPLEQKDAFVRTMQTTGHPSFQITEKSPQGTIVPVPSRSVYFPVCYVEPYEGNEKALGFDLASNPVRFRAMQQALARGIPTATQGVQLVPGKKRRMGILIFHPIFLEEQNTDEHPASSQLAGYVLGVFRIGIVLEEFLSEYDLLGIQYSLHDVTSTETRQLLYTSAEEYQNGSSAQLQFQSTFEVAGRKWSLHGQSTDAYYTDGQHKESSLFLIGGLFFATLFSAYIYMFTGRSEKIKTMVQKRTAELSQTRDSLEQENRERKRLEEKLLQGQRELEKKIDDRTAKLRQSEVMFRTLTESAPDAIIIVDQNNRIRLANKQAGILFGYQNDELTGRSHSTVLPSHINELHLQHQKDYFKKPASRSMGPELSLYGMRKDRTEFPVEISLSPTTLEGEQLVISMIRDVTDRKRIETELRDRVEDLISLHKSSISITSSRSLAGVTKTAISAIISSISPDMVIVYLKENNHMTMQDFYSENPNDQRVEDHKHRVGSCLCGLTVETGKAVYSKNIHADTRCTQTECKQAGYRSFAAIPLVSRDNILGVLGLGSLTERDFGKQDVFLEILASQIAAAIQNALFYQKLEQQAENLERQVAQRTDELKEAMERAQESDQLKSAFLATMSHELRTPLNSIIGFTGMILMGLTGELNEEQKKQLEMVQNSARHLLNLINDVLDISKIEAGQLTIARESFSLPELLAQVIETMTAMAHDKGLELIADVADDVATITSDKRRVEQVLINLINNAIKFTPAGGIHVRCSIENNLLALSVQDTGIGFAPEDMDKLFSAFHQLQTGLDRKHEGTGLGLSICKKLVKLLGGNIRASSEGPGKGSLFTFTLPLES